MNVYLDGDKSQEYLGKYCKTTEYLLNQALNKLDSSAYGKIHTSLDLGFPHDLIRIAGGFATGSFVEWKCNIPFIPIDTTVNVCTGSIFELEDDRILLLNADDITVLQNKISESSYIFNFQRGNHFIIIAQSEYSKKFYLILHSSASEFKKQYNGLYPVTGNWFHNEIQVVQKDDRYIRFISGTKAELFGKMAKKLEIYNEIRHSFVADSLLNRKLK